MGKMKPFGLLFGLAGNAAIGLALDHLLQNGSCGGSGMPACPDSLTPWILALPADIMVSVIAIFLGGGAYVFTGVFLAVGLGSMASSAFGDGGADTETFSWIFGGAFRKLWAYADPEPGAPREVHDLFERATAPQPAPDDTVDQLTKLNDLRMSGALTDEEFTAAKHRLLGVGVTP